MIKGLRKHAITESAAERSVIKPTAASYFEPTSKGSCFKLIVQEKLLLRYPAFTMPVQSFTNSPPRGDEEQHSSSQVVWANVSDKEVPEPCVHANRAVGEVLEPCVRGIMAIGGALEPCRSTAVGAAGTLLTSSCFRRGLRTAVVMDARGEPSLLVTGASQMGRRSCSPVA